MTSMDFFRPLRREQVAPAVFWLVFLAHQAVLWGAFLWLRAAPPKSVLPVPDRWVSAAALLMVQLLAASMAYCLLRLPHTVRLPLLLLAVGVFIDVVEMGLEAYFGLIVSGWWTVVPKATLVLGTVWLTLISRTLVTRRLQAERDLAEKDLALTQLAERDFLTGLLNRAGFSRRLPLDQPAALRRPGYDRSERSQGRERQRRSQRRRRAT